MMVSWLDIDDQVVACHDFNSSNFQISTRVHAVQGLRDQALEF